MVKLFIILCFLFTIYTQNIKINEVYRDNNEFWIELFNQDDIPYSLNNYYIKLLPTIAFNYLIRIDNDIINPNSFLLISLHSKCEQNITHILLVDPSQEYTFDTFSFGAIKGEGSYSRYPDGGFWREYLDSSPTPGAPNKILNNQLSQEINNNFEIHVFNVGQGDSQLIIFPSGYTILIDVYESNWNSNNGAEYVADRIRDITGSSYIDVGVISHLHLDHMGYAGYGGFWHLIEKEDIQFGKIIDRNAGLWADWNNDNICDPDNEIKWNIVGTYSGTASNWLCYATNPENNKIYPIREIAELCSINQIQPPDNNTFVQIITTDAIGAYMEDGNTPVTGNYSSWDFPPSENDYSIGLLIGYNDFRYVTMGDLDGDYDYSSYGYTYNNVEKIVAPRVGHVDVYHVNHHGSSHSSSEDLLNILRPTVSLISCGIDNSYGHPDQNVLNRLLDYGDIFLTSDCDTTRNYGSAERLNKDIVLSSSDGITYSINGLNSNINFKSTKKIHNPICSI